jgi:hypothetical protein
MAVLASSLSHPLRAARSAVIARMVGIGIIVAALAGIAPAADAHAPENIPLNDLARSAGVIVEGHVRSVQSAWNDAHTQIYTTVTLQVASYYKGGDGGSQLAIRMLGGTVGDVTLAVLEQPRFTPEEDVVVFLSPQYAQGVFPVVAGDEGKFTETLDPLTRRLQLVSSGLVVPKSEMTDKVARMNAGLPIGR